MRWIQQIWHVSMQQLLRVCRLFFFSESGATESKKANAEHKRSLNHEESLLQSLLIQAPVVTPCTTSSPYSIVTTRCFLHDTTLSCLPLDSDYNTVARHDSNLTEEVSHAGAIC